MRCKDRGISAVCAILVCAMTMDEAHDNIDAAIEQLVTAGYDREHRYSMLTVPRADICSRF